MAVLKLIKIHQFLVSGLIILLIGTSSAVAQIDDYCIATNNYKILEIKSAFIIKLTSYVEWPSEAFIQTPDSFVITILGNDPFQNVIDYFEGKIIKGRKLRIRRIKTVNDIGNSHVLFISSSESQRIKEIIAAIQNMNTLTIGDSEGFAKRGVIINFFIEKCSVRFEINPAAVSRSKLKISSRLFRLAKIIEDEE